MERRVGWLATFHKNFGQVTVCLGSDQARPVNQNACCRRVFCEERQQPLPTRLAVVKDCVVELRHQANDGGGLVLLILIRRDEPRQSAA